MKHQGEFRQFYNHSIFPELMRLERKRKGLVFSLAISAVVFLIAAGFVFSLHINALSLFLMMPFLLYVGFVVYQISRFKINFKPKVVNLILEFLEGDMVYQPKGSISKAIFGESGIFPMEEIADYAGEDLIRGKNGLFSFELCELRVRRAGVAEGKMMDLFDGIFFHGILSFSHKGKTLIIPKLARPKLTKTIRKITLGKGEQILMNNDDYNELFFTYTTDPFIAKGLLSDEMIENIIGYQEKVKKDIYLSFFGKNIYIAVEEPKDILEPYIFKSNVSFSLIQEFYQDISIILQIVEDFDFHH